MIKEEVEKARREKISKAQAENNSKSKFQTGQKIAPSEPKEENKSRTKIAEMFNTNRQYISDAEKLKQEAPEIFNKVKTGELTINKAKNELKAAAAAMAEFARRENLALDKQNELGEYRVLIDRKMGEWLDENFPHGRNQHSRGVTTGVTPQKMPVNNNKSSQSRLLHRIDEDVIKDIEDKIKEKGEVITPHRSFSLFCGPID